MELKKVLRILTGSGLVLLGIAGIILPILPGWVFLIPGLIMLADYFPPVRRLVEWAKRKAGGEYSAGGGDPGKGGAANPE
jgi:uncharacterized membrane protein YbaN (DUF454 family)